MALGNPGFADIPHNPPKNPEPLQNTLLNIDEVEEYINLKKADPDGFRKEYMVRFCSFYSQTLKWFK